MSQRTLQREIIELSEADDWPTAREEWELANIWWSDEPQTCLCGHTPIIEICEIRNRMTGAAAEVGNHCVNIFLGHLGSGGLFDSARRVRKETWRSFSPEMIAFAHKHGWISDWDRGFYRDNRLKRELSEKQALAKQRINTKILRRLTHR